METKFCVNWERKKKLVIHTFCFVMFSKCEQCSVREYCDKNYSSAFISKNGKLGRYVPYFNRGRNINCKWA
jgi:hypothetical protein